MAAGWPGPSFFLKAVQTGTVISWRLNMNSGEDNLEEEQENSVPDYRMFGVGTDGMEGGELKGRVFACQDSRVFQQGSQSN